jgi:hypothetical protein
MTIECIYVLESCEPTAGEVLLGFLALNFNSTRDPPLLRWGSRHLSLMQAWDVARKCPSAEYPSFVANMAEIENVFEIGRWNCLLASACSGQVG